MALFYIAGCIYILFANRAFLGESFQLIISSAFTPHAAGGGFLGTTVMMAARYGIARGLFSNESGLGSAPIVAAAAQTRNPVRQALVSSTGTFWDTVVICALTGLVLVSSVLAFPDIDYTQGGTLTKAAFGKIPYIGTTILAVGILTFAFSTILGWTYYSGKAIEYLGGKKWVKPYRIIWIICVYLGSIMNLQVVWNIADSVNALMAIPNLISLLFLSGVAVKAVVFFGCFFYFFGVGVFQLLAHLVIGDKLRSVIAAVTAVKIGGVAGKGGEHQYQHQSGCQVLFLELGRQGAKHDDQESQQHGYADIAGVRGHQRKAQEPGALRV